MISNHYPLIFATRFNWLIAPIVLALGPIIRHFFNERHAGRKSPWWVWGVAALGMIAIAFLSAAGPRDTKRDAAVDAQARLRRRPGHHAVPLQHVPRRRAGI